MRTFRMNLCDEQCQKCGCTNEYLSVRDEKLAKFDHYLRWNYYKTI